MKKIITLALALAFVTPVQAEASCGEGQLSGIEVNATTKEVRSYCFTPEPVVQLTQEQKEQKLQQDITNTITQQKNVDAPKQLVETQVSAEPESINETLTKIEINATTGEIKTLPLNEVEIAEVIRLRTLDKARQNAQTEAQKLASENQGTHYCVNWVVQENIGVECGFDPIPATTEEVQEEFDFLKALFAFDWSGFLNLWQWRW